MKTMRHSFILSAILLMALTTNAQSAAGDKDKKAASNTKEVKTKAEPAKETIKEPVATPGEKSSGIPNTHQMAVPAGSQVELPKVASPK